MSSTRRTFLKALFVGTALAFPVAKVALQDAPRKLKPVVSVVDDYWAVGDGAFDCTDAIQAAFDDMAEIGGTVIFPMGNFRTTAPLILEGSGVQIIGHGGGISYEGESGGAIEMSGENHGIYNMNVKASGTNAACLWINDIQGALIHSCVFSSGQGQPFFIPPPRQQNPIVAQIREFSA